MEKDELLQSKKKHFLKQLQTRFEQNSVRHPHSTWRTIEEKLANTPSLLTTIYEMELSGCRIILRSAGISRMCQTVKCKEIL